jgi:hypothetical protein
MQTGLEARREPVPGGSRWHTILSASALLAWPAAIVRLVTGGAATGVVLCALAATAVNATAMHNNGVLNFIDTPLRRLKTRPQQYVYFILSSDIHQGGACFYRPPLQRKSGQGALGLGRVVEIAPVYYIANSKGERPWDCAIN